MIDLIKRLSSIWNYCLGQTNNHAQQLIQWMKRVEEYFLIDDMLLFFSIDLDNDQYE